MDYKCLLKKLKKGVALADREVKVGQVKKFSSKTAKLAFESARDTAQLDGLDGFGEDFVTQLRTGAIIPDQYLGWSTKTILAALIVLLILKLKKAQKEK